MNARKAANRLVAEIWARRWLDEEDGSTNTDVVAAEECAFIIIEQAIHDAIRMDLPGAPDDGTITKWLAWWKEKPCFCGQSLPSGIPCESCMANRTLSALDFADASLMKFATDSEAFLLGFAAGKMEGASTTKALCLRCVDEAMSNKMPRNHAAWRSLNLLRNSLMLLPVEDDTVAVTE